MADLKTICIDNTCMNNPIYQFPVVRVTTVEELNAIDYPCMVYGNFEIPGTGLTGYDWNGIVIPTSVQTSQYIDFGGNNVWARSQDSAGADWAINPLSMKAGSNIQISGDTISATDTKYTAGTNVQISSSNVISATDTKYTASDANPLMDGTATPGTSAKYAREGHRHPTDTTRAPLASPAFTGTPTAPTNSTASTSNTQIATTAFVQNAIKRRLPTSGLDGQIADFSLANNTYVNKKIYTATATGRLFISVNVSFASNATGIRSVGLINGEGTQLACMQVPAATSSETILCVSGVTYATSGDEIKVRFRQTSGAALQVKDVDLDGYMIVT